MAKKLGRSELLTWINKTTESDYIRIEDLSDGVGFCQLIEAFFPGKITPEMNKVKLNAINELDHRHKNFCLLNVLLGKVQCFKQLDPVKMSKGIFSPNFEFLQYIYDFIFKTFNKITTKKRYKGLKRRIEILKAQQGNKAFRNITKFLPSHLITNELILQIERDKSYNPPSDSSSSSSGDETEDEELKNKLDKYKKFFRLLEEDLDEILKRNGQVEEEIDEIEEEKEYYLDKLKGIYKFLEGEMQGEEKEEKGEKGKICREIMQKIESVPEEFK